MRSIARKIGDTRFVWFQANNTYVRMEEPAYEVYCRMKQNVKKKEIILFLVSTYGIEELQATQFFEEMKMQLPLNIETDNQEEALHFFTSSTSHSTRYYRYVDTLFSITFPTAAVAEAVSPILQHVELEKIPHTQHQFHLQIEGEHIQLSLHETPIGNWIKDEFHLMLGKLYSEITNLCYDKMESDWSALLHGAAISNDSHAIALTGNSGNGKSTSTALLCGNGYQFLNDDFVPIEAKTNLVYPFPTAMSVKQSATDKVAAYFPSLKKEKLHSLANGAQKVRYLSHHSLGTKAKTGIPLKALVAVHYDPAQPFLFCELPKELAFQELIEEAWLSPLPSNVESLFEMLEHIKTYRLVYSTTKQLIDTIDKIMQNEL